MERPSERALTFNNSIDANINTIKTKLESQRNSANSDNGLLNLQAPKREKKNLCKCLDKKYLLQKNERKFEFDGGSSKNPLRRYIYIMCALQISMFVGCQIPWLKISNSSEPNDGEEDNVSCYNKVAGKAVATVL